MSRLSIAFLLATVTTAVAAAPPSSAAGRRPSLSADDAGTVHLLWLEGEPDLESLRHAVAAPGSDWLTTPAVGLGPGVGPLDSALDEQGTLHVVWDDARPDGEASAVYHRSWSTAGGWSVSQRISDGVSEAGSPALAALPGPRLAAAWQQFDSEGFVQVRLRGARADVPPPVPFGPIVEVTRHEYQADHVDVAAGDGLRALVWDVVGDGGVRASAWATEARQIPVAPTGGNPIAAVTRVGLRVAFEQDDDDDGIPDTLVVRTRPTPQGPAIDTTLATAPFASFGTSRSAVVGDCHGGLHAVYLVGETARSVDVTYRYGDGARWWEPVRLTELPGELADPTLAVSVAVGQVHVAWTELGPEPQVRFSTLPAEHLGPCP